jgi:hypothetical protein
MSRMSYPQGYPPPQGYYQQPVVTGANPATAVIGAVLGLLMAASLAVVNFDFLGDLRDGVGLSDLPKEVTIMVIIRFVAAGLAVIAAVIVLIRKVAGAIVLAAAGLAGVLAVLLWPVLLGNVNPRLGDLGDYLTGIFHFDSPQSTFSAIALIASPLVLILAVVPPTLKYLRGSAAFPQQGYPQGW